MQALESLTDSQVGEVSCVRIREVSYPPPPTPHTLELPKGQQFVQPCGQLHSI